LWQNFTISLIKPSPLEGTPHDILYTEGSPWKNESCRRLVRGRRKFRDNETWTAGHFVFTTLIERHHVGATPPELYARAYCW